MIRKDFIFVSLELINAVSSRSVAEYKGNNMDIREVIIPPNLRPDK